MQRISRRDSQAAVERNKVIEAGYQTVKGSRTYRASVYAEEVSDAAFLMSGDSGFVDAGDLLPDLSSRGTVFDLGDYRRMGYSASVTQALGDRVEVSVAAGHTDALQLQTSPDALPASGDELRSGDPQHATALGNRARPMRLCRSPVPIWHPATAGPTPAS